MDIFYIGGSPCSGKSTVAEIIAKKFDLHYFRVDDHLEEYIQAAADNNYPISSKISGMKPEQIWMRNPVDQKDEELELYREMFGFIKDDLNKINHYRGIIAEGVAFLPELMWQEKVKQNHFLCITPTIEFQISHYKERTWISNVLKGCSNQELAFENWMNRDALFAKEVRRMCMEVGYHSLINDGSSSIDEMVHQVIRIYELKM